MALSTLGSSVILAFDCPLWEKLKDCSVHRQDRRRHRALTSLDPSCPKLS